MAGSTETDTPLPGEPLAWDDSLSVGVPEIDNEHKALVGLYNDAVRAFAAGCRVEQKRRLLHELRTYAFYHFGTEEALMRVCRYPRIREHGGEHAQFRREVEALEARIDSGVEFERHALTFIRTWITTHILGSDKQLGAFLAEIATRWAGQRPGHGDAGVGVQGDAGMPD